MATPVFSNGYLLRDTRLDLGSHLDSYHLRNLMMTKKPTSLGVVEYWAQTQQAQPFLYNFASFGGKNRKVVDDVDGKYTWDVPVVNDVPHITRDIEPTNTKKGLNKLPFRIALNRRAYGKTAVITWDKMAGIEMRVLDVEDTLNGEVIYTCTIHSGTYNTFIPNSVLIPQTPIFRKSSMRGEYGESWNDSTSRAGMRTFYNFLGTAEANSTYSISSRAHDMMSAKGGVPIREMIKFNEWDPNDPSRINIPDQAAKIRQIGLLKAMEEGIISYSFVLETEQRCLNDVIRDIEEYMMWGLGGYSEQDGADGIRTPVGLWGQLDNSFKRVYNIGTWDMGILESELYNYYNGRVDFIGPDPKREVIVQTGMAGMKQVNYSIAQSVSNSGMIVNASEVGAISSASGKTQIPQVNGMDLRFGFAYTSYVIPFLANVKFVVNPALDPVLANDIENPFVNGYRTSSYCYIIWDVTANGGNDNIYMMEWYYDKGLKWFYQNGTANYMGDQKGFLSSGDFNGYNVKMTQYHKGVQVMDPTRILKIVPINVATNAPFGS